MSLHDEIEHNGKYYKREELLRRMLTGDFVLAPDIIAVSSATTLITEVHGLMCWAKENGVPYEKLLVCVSETSQTLDLKKVYGGKINIIVDDECARYFHQIATMVPHLCVNIGITHYTCFKPSPQHPASLHVHNGHIFFQMLNKWWVNRWYTWCTRLNKFRKDNPLLDFDYKPTPDLKAILDPSKPLALIYCRAYAENSAATPTDPETMVGAVDLLNGRGFQIVHIGREPTPPIFKEMGVIPYSDLPVASFANDLFLFRHAKFNLIASSGLAFLTILNEMPGVWFNYWQWPSSPVSDNYILLPSRLRDRRSGKIVPLSVLEIEFYENNLWYFPADLAECLNADREDITDACIRALDYGPDSTERGVMIRDIEMQGPLQELRNITFGRVPKSYLSKLVI